MSVGRRREMIEPELPRLWIVRQCELVYARTAGEVAAPASPLRGCAVPYQRKARLRRDFGASLIHYYP